MMFHLPSFLLGYASGLATGVVLPRLRPVAVEVVTAAYAFVDEVAVRVAAVREDVEDIVAEARERVRTAARRGDGEDVIPEAKA